MKTLYFECGMGAAGDMLMAALLETHKAPEDFLKRLNGIGIPGAVIRAHPAVKCGITGTRIKVAVDGKEEDGDYHDHHHRHPHEEHEHHDEHGHNHEYQHEEHVHHHDHPHNTHEHSHGRHDHHSHNSYHDIEHLISHLNVSLIVKKNILAVYTLIAEAESRAHGVPVEKIHFHEVGDKDALADIAGVCMLIEELAPELILASPVNTGSGHVRCAHGILPVPAPATAFILQNVPIYNDLTQGELCTPTGAALLKHFVKEFRAMPVLAVEKIGYGMGKKEFDKANCIRAFLGNTADANEDVTELTCNLDDMTPEAAAFTQQLLLDEGALDVYTAPVCMKKGRMGLVFTCMCRSELKDKMISLIFKHTSTLGIRENVSRRHVLQREQTTVYIKNKPVRIKTSYGYGVRKSKPEYEDIAKIARENDISIQDVLNEIERGDVYCLR